MISRYSIWSKYTKTKSKKYTRLIIKIFIFDDDDDDNDDEEGGGRVGATAVKEDHSHSPTSHCFCMSLELLYNSYVMRIEFFFLFQWK